MSELRSPTYAADMSLEWSKNVWERVRSSWMPGDPYQPEPLTPNTYVAKAMIAADFQPRTVVEIGVRAGYSAVAFREGHRFEAYLGIDADNGLWGGQVGFCEHAKKLLGSMEHLEWELFIVDSHALQLIKCDGRPFDLAHVDGDHSLEGAIADIELCLRSDVRFIAVDDVDFIPEVRVAVMKMIKEHNLQFRYYNDGGYRGTTVLWKPGVTPP